MTTNRDIETALRSLDAAGPADVAVDPVRAAADLERILATDPRAPAGSGQRSVVRRVRPRRPVTLARVAPVGGLVAAVTAGVLVVSSALGGDPAYASWSPTPDDLSSTESEQAGRSCRQEMGSDITGGSHSDQLDRSRPAIAERRGQWTLVVLAGESGFSATCITSSDRSSFEHSMTGAIGVSATPQPGPRSLVAEGLGVGSGTAGEFSLAEGLAGAEVTAVRYRSLEHGEVAATVNGGRFALWMPGDELEGAPRQGAAVEVTYLDGTTSTSTLSFR